MIQVEAGPPAVGAAGPNRPLILVSPALYGLYGENLMNGVRGLAPAAGGASSLLPNGNQA